ncbi:MAG: hypothetical protein M1823_005897 [Watsoniomyces obsoletus]|nr:MAG: hypothetical protein M1823_005897 [Watsoniomyces obsoletus]
MTRPLPNATRDWPVAPKLYDEVEWGPYPSTQDYKHAYNAWIRPYETLLPVMADHQPQNEIAELEEYLTSPLETLVGFIHHRFRTNHQTVPEPNEHAQSPGPGNRRGAPEGWRAEQFLTMTAPVGADPRKQLIVAGRKLYAARKPELQEECRRRGLDDQGLKPAILARIIEHALRPIPPENCRDLFPRSRLRHWGIDRVGEFRMPFGAGHIYRPIEMYTIALHLSPYNPTYWVARAFLFFQQGHYDLALGDAYRAEYLVHIVDTVQCRAKRPGLFPRIVDALEQHLRIVGDEETAVRDLQTRDQGIPYFTMAIRKVCAHIITLSLQACQDVFHATLCDTNIISRCLMGERDRRLFTERRGRLAEETRRQEERRRHPNHQLGPEDPYLLAGTVAVQPWPEAVTDESVPRNMPTIVDRLTQEYVQRWPGDGEGDQACLRVEVANDEGDGVSLRVVANRDLVEGEIIYAEEPNVRGYLQMLRTVEVADLESHEGGRRMVREVRYPDPAVRGFFCENCRRPVTGAQVDDARRRAVEARRLDRRGPENQHENFDGLRDACACLFTDPLICFCPPPAGEAAPAPEADEGYRRGTKRAASPTRNTRGRTKRARTGNENANPNYSCLEIARRTFHHDACGKNWRWLHEGMTTYKQTFATDTVDILNRQQGTPLSLLLREVLDMTIKARRDPDLDEPHLLAHEIDALLPLSAEESNREQRFPFSYVGNVVVPFDIAETLGVNIFRDLDFDTWVMQLVLRKLSIHAIAYPNPESIHEQRLPNQALLHIMSGFGLFNHGCGVAANARWAYDEVERALPMKNERNNRIIVRANRAIEAGEEVRVRYFNSETDVQRAQDPRRYLGRPCRCRVCRPPPGA